MMLRPLTAAVLVALPLLSSGFLAPGALPPSLRAPRAAACASSRTVMQLADGPSERRDVLKVLGLAPFAAAGLAGALADPEAAAAKLLPQEETLINIFERSVPSVAYISTEYTSIAQANNVDLNNLPKGVGSGFVWDKEGHIVTNFHVINKVDNALVTLTDSKGNTKQYKAKLTGVDPDKDLAVLKVDAPASDLIPLPLGESSGLRVGQFAMAIGNPFGQEKTLTTGVISGKNRQITAPTGRKINGVIQTDAAINPGNSGGPLLNSDGKIVGINTAALGSGTSAGVSFAIPIDVARGVVDQLVKYGQASRAVLGISYLERLPSPAEAERSGIPRIENGVVVLEVPPNSPCAKAGMIATARPGNGQGKPVIGDVIVGIDKYPIMGAADLSTALDNFRPGDKVKIQVKRGPKLEPKELLVTLGAFRGSSFSKIESERPVPEGEGIVQMNIPLENLAPAVTPSLPPN